MKRKIRQINVRYLSICFLLIAFSMIIFCVFKINEVNSCIDQQNQVEKSRRICEEQSRILEDTSDYLTEEVRRFIATGKVEYMANYWQEIDHEQRREKAIEKLSTQNLTKEEIASSNTAKETSDQLVIGETWAMRLVSESFGMKKSQMPQEVADVKLSRQQKSLSPEEKQRLAINYIFGDQYMASKQKINANLEDFQTSLTERKNQELTNAVNDTNHALEQAQLYIILVYILLILIFLILYMLVLKPFIAYSNTLLGSVKVNDSLVLTPAGSKEMRIFAKAFNEICCRWQAQNRHLKELNATDFLTKVANRETIYRYLHEQIQNQNSHLGIIMIDIDSFKAFNDAYSHQAGDKVLERIGRCLKDSISPEAGLTGRLGGEEFIIVLKAADASLINNTVTVIAENMQRLNLEHTLLPLTDTHITVSMGSFLWLRSKSYTAQDLIHLADLALYEAKKRGRSQHILFTENDYSIMMLEHDNLRQNEVEADMYRALEEGEFVPFYQAKYNLSNEQIASAEALARWQHKDKGLLSPDYFIPVFEKNGFITKLDFFIFESVCKNLTDWIRSGRPAIPVACNFSRLHFKEAGLAETLKEITDRYGLPTSLFEVEITENIFLESAEVITDEVKKLQALGFTIAIDDFGIGYSSLGVIHDIPADVLKIDKSFLQRDLQVSKNVMLIKGIIKLAQALNLETVCEGVETKEQKELLKSIGCDYAQGYYYAKPMEQKHFEALLEETMQPAE